MVETEPDKMLIEQHEPSNQLNDDRIDASPESRTITQTGKRNATQAPTLAKGSQSVRSPKRLTGDPGISLTSVVQECAGESSSNRTVSSSNIGLSDTEGLVSSNMAMVDKIDDTGDHDKVFLTMSLIDASHMTRIMSDRYARLDSKYMINQPHDAARTPETTLQSNSGRSERACTIHSKCQCHPTVPGREELYHIFPLTLKQFLWDFATSESRECLECSQQDSQFLQISQNLQAIILEVSVDISKCQFGSLMPAPTI